MHFKLPARALMWVVGAFLAVATGAIALTQSIAGSSSLSSVPDDSGIVTQGSQPPARPATDRARRVWCPDCGVIESMRQFDPPDDPDDQNAGSRDAAGAAPEDAARARATKGASGRRYHVTIRFRDGTAIVFDEATPRTWRVGGRVIVIGGTNAAANTPIR